MHDIGQERQKNYYNENKKFLKSSFHKLGKTLLNKIKGQQDNYIKEHFIFIKSLIQGHSINKIYRTLPNISSDIFNISELHNEELSLMLLLKSYNVGVLGNSSHMQAHYDNENKNFIENYRLLDKQNIRTEKFLDLISFFLTNRKPPFVIHEDTLELLLDEFISYDTDFNKNLHRYIPDLLVQSLLAGNVKFTKMILERCDEKDILPVDEKNKPRALSISRGLYLNEISIISCFLVSQTEEEIRNDLLELILNHNLSQRFVTQPQDIVSVLHNIFIYGSSSQLKKLISHINVEDKTLFKLFFHEMKNRTQEYNKNHPSEYDNMLCLLEKYISYNDLTQNLNNKKDKTITRKKI